MSACGFVQVYILAPLCVWVPHSTFVTTILYIPSPSDAETTNEDGSLTYLPGKSRSHHMEMMMSKEELEEEQRSVYTSCSPQYDSLGLLRAADSLWRFLSLHSHTRITFPRCLVALPPFDLSLLPLISLPLPTRAAKLLSLPSTFSRCRLDPVRPDWVPARN